MTSRILSLRAVPCVLTMVVHVLTALPLAYAAEGTFHVAPSGNDDDPGTRAKPFKTLGKARDAVRAAKGKIDGDVTVILRDGTYRLDDTLRLDHRDSGAVGHDVVYKAEPGETPVISGGRPIGGWQRDQGDRWKASTALPDFRQLYVNGKRATRARGGPLPDAKLHGDDGYTTSLAGMAGWRNQADVELCYYVVWCHTRCKVERITREGDGAVVKMLQPWFTIARKKEGVHVDLPSYVENALELLDEPGEWYLDRPAKTVYYIPRPGEDMSEAEVIAPVVETLVALEGTLDKPVERVRFEGITFAQAGWLRPNKIGHVDVQANFIMGVGDNQLRRKDGWTMIHNEHIKSPSNIVCRATRSVRFERCTFTQLGSGGIDLEFGAQDNVIDGCRFHDISGTAVQIGDVLKDDHHPDDPRKIVRNNQVTNCTIRDVCLEYSGGVGVFAGYTDSTRIANNLICDLPYSGVSIGWGWGEEDAGGGSPSYYQPFKHDTPTPAKDNRIECNHIHHIMQDRNDGGGIYTLGNQPGTIIQGNHIHDAKGSPGGIYLDEGSGFIEVTGNVVHNVRTSMNFNNRVQNRIATCKVHDNFFDVGSGAVGQAPGKVGKALACDGGGAFFQVVHSPELEPEQMTIEAWVRLDEFPEPFGKEPRRWIVNKNANEFADGHYALMIDGDRAGAYLNIGGGPTNCHEAWSARGLMKPKQWHHIAMTYDGKMLSVYVDGRFAASQVVGKRRTPGSTPLQIGRRQDGHVTLTGLIDEVRFYNRPLTAEEIKSDYEALVGSPEKIDVSKLVKTGLISNWSFDKPTEPDPAAKENINKAGPAPAYQEVNK
ncbi:MAG: right-handed parallel beta-helix repeat-containing protein [Phycisphaerae bacterium]|nr:right-handed parallel beta-helix repeat-containing protein [Phycisphaerae bacterium]